MKVLWEKNIKIISETKKARIKRMGRGIKITIYLILSMSISKGNGETSKILKRTFLTATLERYTKWGNYQIYIIRWGQKSRGRMKTNFATPS